MKYNINSLHSSSTMYSTDGMLDLIRYDMGKLWFRIQYVSLCREGIHDVITCTEFGDDRSMNFGTVKGLNYDSVM